MKQLKLNKGPIDLEACDGVYLIYYLDEYVALYKEGSYFSDYPNGDWTVPMWEYARSDYEWAFLKKLNK